MQQYIVHEIRLAALTLQFVLMRLDILLLTRTRTACIEFTMIPISMFKAADVATTRKVDTRARI